MADAFGRMLLDGTGLEIIERDDGFVDAAKMIYFTPAAKWPAVERRALRWARGRVLDAGLGAACDPEEPTQWMPQASLRGTGGAESSLLGRVAVTWVGIGAAA